MATTKNTDTAADEIPRGFNLVAAHLRDITVVLNAIEQQMEERNNLLRGPAEAGVQRGFDKAEAADPSGELEYRVGNIESLITQIPDHMNTIEKLVAGIPGLVASLETRIEAHEDAIKRLGSALAARGPTLVPAEPTNGAAKAIAGRIIEHTVAQVQGGHAASASGGALDAMQTQEAVVPGSVVKRGRGRPADPKKCAHPADKLETLESGLRRCTRCGAVLEATVTTSSAEKVAAAVSTALDAGRTDVAQAIVEKVIAGPPVVMSDETAKALATKAVAAVKAKLAERIEAEKATLDDVRAVAIGYAGKHGKEKLGAVLVKYGAGNLSSVPAEKYDALMVELQAAG
jgi:hypothetical protein